jgi:serine protease inhibitor
LFDVDQNGVAMSSPYLRALDEFYQIKAEPLDFKANNCSLASSKINDWIRTQAEGQLSNALMRPPACDSKLFVFSALLLEAQLLHQFQASDTFQKGLFFLPGNKRLVLWSLVLSCT